MDEIPLSQPGEVILENMSITQKKASYPEFSILNHSLESWGKGMCVRNTSHLIASSMQVCQKHLQAWSCLLQEREISHSIPQEGSEESLMA